MTWPDADDLDAPADIVPRRRHRPDKATVARLLAAAGHDVTWHESRVTEDVDGIPNGVETTTQTGTLSIPDLAQLGWTEAEYADPTVTE